MLQSRFAVLFVMLAALAMSACGSATKESAPIHSGNASAGQDLTSKTYTVVIPLDAAGRGTAAFGENPLVIPTGSTVTWINGDGLHHQIISNDGTIVSPSLWPGESFKYTFNNPGTFPYSCGLHGAGSESGVIQVTGLPVTPAAPSGQSGL